MSGATNQNTESKKWYQCHYRIIGVAICAMLLLLLIGNWMTYCLINKERKNSTQIISSILNNSSKEKSLIPNIIIISKNDSSAIKLDSSLKKELINYLNNKFNGENTNENNVFDIKPYLSSTDIKDEDKIVKHIEFLINTVNKAVEESKANIDTEMSKINTWVTIWIGIIGIIGIFLPIMINLKSFDELKSIKSKSKDSKRKVDGFDKKIGAQEERINTLSNQYPAIEKSATNAETRSKSTEKLLYTLSAVFKLKDIDGTFLMFNKEPLKVLVKYFEEIHKELSDKSIDVKHPFVFDALRQLALRLYVLAPYPFISKNDMTLFNNLSEFITTRLETGITEESLKEILVEFNLLITTLKSH